MTSIDPISASHRAAPECPPCLLKAWQTTQKELLAYLRHRLDSVPEAEDLLQEVFLRALRQGQRFCAVNQPRAWIFQVARNALADRLRVHRENLPLPEVLASENHDASDAVDDLSQCLPRVLSELKPADRLAIELCDLGGAPQQVLAEHLGISLSGAKSRLQRARQRLKERMESACQVRYNESGHVESFTPRPPLK